MTLLVPAQKAVDEVAEELVRALQRYPSFRSDHEGYAILLEEVEELWAEVKKRPTDRSLAALRAEAAQVAAMALRFMIDLT